MPYIKPEQRAALDPLIDALVNGIESTGGSLSDRAGIANYCMTRIAIDLLRRDGDLRYWKIALMSGVFANAGDEFYRRVGVPYEDAQIAKNGDVY